MDEEDRDDRTILTRFEPSGNSLTAGPFEVGIIIRNGAIDEVFTEGKRRVRQGVFDNAEVKTLIAYTSPFRLDFWLADPDDPSEPDGGITLDRPVLTSEGELVTGWISVTLSIMQNQVDRTLQLLGARDVVMASDVADAIKSELLAKVLALDTHQHTAADLRGNRDLLSQFADSLKVELGTTIGGYGLRLVNFFVHWGLTPEERERIKDQRHEETIRDIERQQEMQAARRLKQRTETDPDTVDRPDAEVWRERSDWSSQPPPLSQADRIRQYALEHFVEPARQQGHRNVAIRLGDVQEGIGTRSNVPNFINALGGRKFLEMADLRSLGTSGAQAGPNTVFHFELSEPQGVAIREFRRDVESTDPHRSLSQADRIRQYALERYIEPARQRGDRQVAIRLGDVQAGIGTRSNVPNFINALGGRKFLEMAGLELLGTSGAQAGPNTVFHFELNEPQGVAIREFRQPVGPSAPHRPMSRADRIRHHALEHYVKPVRRQGVREVAIRVGDVQDGIGGPDITADIIQALNTGKFLDMADLRLLASSGSRAGRNTIFHYEIVEPHRDFIRDLEQEQETEWPGSAGEDHRGIGGPSVHSGRGAFEVYTDAATKYSTIHKNSCGYSQNRKANLLPDNWWHGPYMSKEQARSSPKNRGNVRECGTCRP